MNQRVLISLFFFFLPINSCFSMTNSLTSNLPQLNNILQNIDQSFMVTWIIGIPLKQILLTGPGTVDYNEWDFPEFYPFVVLNLPKVSDDDLEFLKKITDAIADSFSAKFIQIEEPLIEEKTSATSPTSYAIVSENLILLDKNRQPITYETLISNLEKNDVLKKYLQPQSLENILPQKINIKTGFTSKNIAQAELKRISSFIQRSRFIPGITLQQDDGAEISITLS